MTAMRARRGRSLDEIAATIRVTRTALEALEGDRTEDLPPPVYVRGFIRAYCRELGYDASDVLKMYDAVVYAQEQRTLEGPSILVLNAYPERAEVDPHRGLQVARVALLAAAALMVIAALFSGIWTEDGPTGPDRPAASIQAPDAGAAGRVSAADSRR
jgi:cytoskeleton protein RodZ